MNLKDLVINSNIIAKEELEKYDIASSEYYELAMIKGIKLAESLNANIDIVKIGTILMDIKIGEATKNGAVEKHIDMGVEKTKEILKDYDLNEKTKADIINCVAAHHGTIPYLSIEAEICANADCYRFLHPRWFFISLNLFFNRFKSLDVALENLENKMDEKYNIISLDIVKKELEQYYQQLKKIIQVAKEKNQNE